VTSKERKISQRGLSIGRLALEYGDHLLEELPYGSMGCVGRPLEGLVLGISEREPERAHASRIALGDSGRDIV